MSENIFFIKAIILNLMFLFEKVDQFNRLVTDCYNTLDIKYSDIFP